ncbi:MULTISPECIES: type I-C CRISPR-associated protein Cas8c/Csd1 [unclassified Ectothiorhodospira]|uniref:type I-C CRISPR-associated protein Cas8c/Csd1 n=1 Tax=unclassified Ectothiorhodospira TaxID=2684909 RepID=UPI001EE96F94|nr:MULTISPECIES: type I-C CRISPR-associated protein Cas8c/Csd1 [unclassified Ectothiorhodospira]MCG5517308.1 type I-C CRISPR-associated protein Cas8c/Csd1 [Ectothiorhodospira sp. 9100]MCG5520200.1 type I-C CRISPR-associated protein Cas8c/Csd1 [Ectothiorhodospira sp. 9905]
MILQALSRYYQRLIEQQAEDVAPFGYSPEKISFEILLGSNGNVVQINDIRNTSGNKPQPRMLNVPQPQKRTVGIKPSLLWDKTSYVLGVSNTSKRADKEHEAFLALHETALSGEDDPGLKALLAFLRGWSPKHFEARGFPPDLIDTNLVFRLDGQQVFLHDRPAARSVRTRLLAGDERKDAAAKEMVCLVSGEASTVARLHPAIKGVNGAQSSGASIVSFNLDAFVSYAKNQGDNAPVSEQAAFAYTTALNYLLRRGEHNRQRLQVGDTTVVFWAEASDADQANEAEAMLAAFLDPPADDASEATRVREVLDGVAKGRPLGDVAPNLDPTTGVYVLGLAPNASRLSVRFWQVDTLEVFAHRIAEHTEDLRLEPLPWRTAPSAYRLVLATVPHREGSKPKSDDAINNVIGETMRAILSGGLYPRSLLANTIMRLRADGDISGLRVALCKGVLARERRRGIRTSKEDIPVSLDKQSTQPGYLLGRLFAVLERVQRAALGSQVNATIRDRYYGAASATPASIFPMLLRNTQNHLGKLRKERVGQAVNLENDIREIVNGLPEHFPRSLKIEDQGRFAIGYYHQSQSYFTRRDTAERAHTESAEPTDIETEGADQ